MFDYQLLLKLGDDLDADRARPENCTAQRRGRCWPSQRYPRSSSLLHCCRRHVARSHAHRVLDAGSGLVALAWQGSLGSARAIWRGSRRELATSAPQRGLLALPNCRRTISYSVREALVDPKRRSCRTVVAEAVRGTMSTRYRVEDGRFAEHAALSVLRDPSRAWRR